MDTERYCHNCGSPLEKNSRVDRIFCSDKCRKYFKRHGGTGYSRISRIQRKDLSGQSRTVASGGGNTVSDYLMKRLIDVGQKVAENKLISTENKSHITQKQLNM